MTALAVVVWVLVTGISIPWWLWVVVVLDILVTVRIRVD